jgi:hypothetical protein
VRLIKEFICHADAQQFAVGDLLDHTLVEHGYLGRLTSFPTYPARRGRPGRGGSVIGRSIARLYAQPEIEIICEAVERVAVNEPEADRLLKLYLGLVRNPRDRTRGRFACGAEVSNHLAPRCHDDISIFRPPPSAGSLPPVMDTTAQPEIDFDNVRRVAVRRLAESAHKVFR